MERTNKITLTGYIAFPKVFGEEAVAQLSLPINRGTQDEPKWDYLNLKVATDKSKFEFKDYDRKRVEVSGYITGEAFMPKDGVKEITVIKIVVGSIKEIEKGVKGVNEVTLTSMSRFIREFGEKGVGAQLSVSFKENKDDTEYKYANISLSGNRNTLKLVDKEIITVKGFIKADFFVPNGQEKEISLPVIVGLDVLEREMPGSTDTADAPPPPVEKEAPDIEIEDDEIPF